MPLALREVACLVADIESRRNGTVRKRALRLLVLVAADGNTQSSALSESSPQNAVPMPVPRTMAPVSTMCPHETLTEL